MVERVIPILPCRYLDDVQPFYEALGFERTYRQERPNPYLAMRRGGIELHFFGLPEFDPEQSLGNVGIEVPDTGVLFDAFAAGLRAAYGKLPLTGLPRITRPRRKQGVPRGFTVVDPGGNWLRISSGDDPGDDGTDERFERVLLNAARQADSHGDEQRAIAVLEAGLRRHPDVTAADRTRALVYLAELLHRTGDDDRARATLDDLPELTPAESAAIATDLETAGELRTLLT